MSLKKGILKSFNSSNYTAVLQLAGSYKTFLEDVPVARNLPESEMIPGRKVATLFFDQHNARDAVILAVYV